MAEDPSSCSEIEDSKHQILWRSVEQDVETKLLATVAFRVKVTKDDPHSAHNRCGLAVDEESKKKHPNNEATLEDKQGADGTDMSQVVNGMMTYSCDIDENAQV